MILFLQHSISFNFKKKHEYTTMSRRVMLPVNYGLPLLECSADWIEAYKMARLQIPLSKMYVQVPLTAVVEYNLYTSN